MSIPAHDVASIAAKGFELFECVECAEAIKKALVQASCHGQIIEIRAKGNSDFMVCRSFDRGRTSITNNGRHVGVLVDELIFDNLNPDGSPYEDWLKNFDAVKGVEVRSKTDF